MQYSRFKTTVLTHVIKLWRGSNIFSVSFSRNIYNFKITSAVWKDNYAHQSLDWETYPLNETRYFKHKIGMFKALLKSLIAQGTWRWMYVASFFMKISTYVEILFW